MIAIDTNILLRYLLDDDEVQSPKAAALVQQHDQILVTDIVLAEAIWTLKGRKYRVDDAGISAAVSALFSEPAIRFENDEAVWRALIDFTDAFEDSERPGGKVSGRTVDFADALIVNKARYCAEQAGQSLEAFYTFDAGARSLSSKQVRILR